MCLISNGRSYKFLGIIKSEQSNNSINTFDLKNLRKKSEEEEDIEWKDINSKRERKLIIQVSRTKTASTKTYKVSKNKLFIPHILC